MTKEDLVKMLFTEDERDGMDYAIPLHVAHSLKEALKGVGLEFNQFMYMTDCNENTSPLVHLGEKLITSGKLEEILTELQTLRYKNKILEKKIGPVTDQDVINDIRSS